jgi:hypothetical protein
MSSVLAGVSGTTSTNQYSALADNPEKIQATDYRTLGGNPSSSVTVNTLLDKIYIATHDVDMIDGTGFVDIQPNVSQLEWLEQQLEELANLPTGDTILTTLNSLLCSKDQKLVFAFTLDDESTPTCRMSPTNVGTAVRIQLPKSCTVVGYELPFYNTCTGGIVKMQEPISMCIGHELLHSVQNLYAPDPKHVSRDVEQRLRQEFSQFFRDQQMCKFCEHFFAGSEGKTWPDELQAMVLGIKANDGQRLSEANLMTEWARQSGHISQEQNGILVPFGHLRAKDTIRQEDMQNFCALLCQSGLFGEVHEPALEPGIVTKPKSTYGWCNVA